MNTAATFSTLHFCKVLEPTELGASIVYYEIAKSHEALASNYQMREKIQKYYKTKGSNNWPCVYEAVFLHFVQNRCLGTIALCDTEIR